MCEEVQLAVCQSDGVPLTNGTLEWRTCARRYSDDCLMEMELERLVHGRPFMWESGGSINTH